MPSLRFEKEFYREGLRRIAGLDEVGRGSLFGPVVAAAVILPAAWIERRAPAWSRRIDDSKVLTDAQKVDLAVRILREAEGLGVGTASSAEIDAMNIFRASQTAMLRAVANLGLPPDILLVDGLPLKDVNYRQMGIAQGDGKCLSIAAASIVAKVFRDGLMEAFDAVYEGYGLARNKGYGTEEHFRSLREKGPTALHRMSFKLR